MSTKRDITSAITSMFARFHRPIGRAPLAFLGVLAMALTVSTRAGTQPAAIPISDIGARATANYQGDALGVTATADGARLRCGFQKLEGQATPEGLWLESTKPGAAGRLRVTASALGRAGLSTINPQLSTALATTGKVSVEDKLVRFTRPGLTEEYSVSVDGVRQDFIIESPPLNPPLSAVLSALRSATEDGLRRTGQRSTLRSTATEDGSTLNQSAGDLRVELALSGARAEVGAGGVRLRLEGSGRALGYSRLRVEDATGRELTARLEVLSPDRLAVSVADANATYPLRIDPTFSDADWVSLNPGLPGANRTVNAILADGSGNVYVGGYFTFIGTTPANCIAKWDGSAWSALGSGIDHEVSEYNEVYALAVSGTNLYAGGIFSKAGGAAATNIARWDGNKWSALGSGTDGAVVALAVSGTNLYAGGTFTTAGGVTVNGIAKWNGSVWSALGSGMGGSCPWVYALAVSDTHLCAGGTFTTAGGVTVNGIAKWDGGAWSALGSGMDYFVYALAVSGTDLYAGGTFTTAGGVPANHIGKWDGRAWSALGSGMNDWVFPLAVSVTNLYAGGLFTMAGGVTANYIAKWDGSTWSALGSGMDNELRALVVSETDLYAGGGFTMAGGVRVNYIAKWDGSAWSALGSGMNDWVTALAVSGTNLYAAGFFTTAGGVPVNYIAKWDGSSWSALGSGMNSSVYALAVSGTDLYAGGAFTTAGGVTAIYIAKWDGSAWSALGSGMNNELRALAVTGTNLYAGGQFTMVGGVTVNAIAKWDGSAWSALGSGMSGSTYASVYALAVSGTDLYAGGAFTTAGGVVAANIAKWDGSAWSALGSGMDGNVEGLAADGAGHLFLDGEFLLAGTNVSPYVAQADLGSVPTILRSPQTQTAEVGATVDFAVDVAGGYLTYQLFFNGTSLLSCGGDSCLELTNVNLSQSGTYTVVVTNAFGAVTSAPVTLNVIQAVDHKLVPGFKVTGHAGSLLGLDYRDSFGPAASWETMATMTLSNSSQFYFDLSAPLPPQRFYRAWQTGIAGVAPSLSLPGMVPAITVTGSIGHSVRLDYINRFGPIDAWVTLDTVALTNTSQLYFDTSSIGQPPRLWRIVPVP